MEIQPGDKNPNPFSFRTDASTFNPTQLPCYIAYTNTTTHSIIENNFYRAPLFTGQIEGTGPRYCPSVEDKINRFRERERHHLFVEPQTLEATEYYINGLSTSLPPDVQLEMLRSIKGFENARIVRHGYAIEYDYVIPTQLLHTLETKTIKGLYCAGQINGTTGYEEAAAQGLMAGINAVLALENKEPLILRRDEAYIGVMIDDLVTKGKKEPKRMFTSRAEFRLLLREDNAPLRLGNYGYKLGLIDEETHKKIIRIQEETRQGLELLESQFISPSKANTTLLESIDEEAAKDHMSYQKIVARKTFTIEKLPILLPQIEDFCSQAKEQILVEAKYKNYIEKQAIQVANMENLLQVAIPEGFDFGKVGGLSNEVKEKLVAHAPPTLFAASQISGITPAALDILNIYIKLNSK